MEDDRAKSILKRYETRKSERLHFDNLWQEVSDHALGRRDFTVDRQQGQKRNTLIYDTTSQDANELLGAALHSLLTNPATNWFDIRYSSAALNNDAEARRYLDLRKDRLRVAFMRPQSGFATQMARVWDDMPGFGNACIYVQDNPAFGSEYIARPLSEVYIETDESGRVVATYRCFKLEAWQAVEEYGKEALPKDIAKSAEKDSGGTEFEFVQHIRKRGMPLPGKMDSTGMAWESITIAVKGKSIVREGGFRSNPLLYPRWKVDTGEDYGRGPGIWSLPNQKMLNRIWRTFIRGSEKAIDPPALMEDNSVVGGRINFTPNGITVVTDQGTGRDPVRYIQNGANPNWAADIMESRARKIEKSFHSEIIQAFQDPRMTATQVLELAKLSQRQLSPMLGRCQEELLDPLIQRTDEIESSRTDFPQPPDMLRDEQILIEYVGPVARAQKAAESQAILDTFAAMQAIAQTDPDVLDNFDSDEAVRLIAEGNGIPVKVLRLPNDVLAIRRQRAQQEAAQQQAQMMVQGGETIAKLLPGIAQLNAASGGALPN